jgi:hypothetical protein
LQNKKPAPLLLDCCLWLVSLLPFSQSRDRGLDFDAALEGLRFSCARPFSGISISSLPVAASRITRSNISEPTTSNFDQARCPLGSLADKPSRGKKIQQCPPLSKSGQTQVLALSEPAGFHVFIFAPPWQSSFLKREP